MLLLQDFTEDVEKDIRKTSERRGTTLLPPRRGTTLLPPRRGTTLLPPLDLSPSLKDSGHGSEDAFFNGQPNLDSSQSPTYRILPIISGILIPFSILLSIPTLTFHWYIRNHPNDVAVENHTHPLLFYLGMGLSMISALLACVCLVVRFAERSVLRMTQFCILFLTLHDLINICAIIIFGVQRHIHDNFTYRQSFWFTVCSTIVSVTTNIALIVDYFRTKDFVNSGSGLTHKQRSLVVVSIIIVCYLALGALAQTFMFDISFLDALYFSVVSIETIGFGDYHPMSTGTVIFGCFYISGGIINLALAVAFIREVLLEAVALGFQDRVRAICTRRHERQIRVRWRTAVKSRLKAKNLPIWIVDSNSENEDWRYHHRHHWWRWANRGGDFLKNRLSREPAARCSRKRKHLNLEALTEREMEDAALVAGAPLADLLPPRLKSMSPRTTCDDMKGEDSEERLKDPSGMQDITEQDEACLEDVLIAEERVAFLCRLAVAFVLFFVFWMSGAIIFMRTENWDFGMSVYFCFMTFTTVGYGDLSPQTPAGRFVFIIWALAGVGTLTILISLVVEGYSRRFKRVIRPDTPLMDSNPSDDRSGIHQSQFLTSFETVNTQTKEKCVFPMSPSETTLTSSPRHYDSDLPPIPESGSKKYKQEGLESLHEILRNAQTLRSLVASEIWREDVSPTESTSNLAGLGIPQINLSSDAQGPGEKFYQIDKTMQEIIIAAKCALDVFDNQQIGITI